MTEYTDHNSDQPSTSSVHDCVNSEAHEESFLQVPVTFAGETHVFELPGDAVLDDLTAACEARWGTSRKEAEKGGEARIVGDYDWSGHKFIGPPPIGLLKGRDDRDRLLALFFGGSGHRPIFPPSRKKPAAAAALRLLASRISDIKALHVAEEASRERDTRRQEALRQRRRQQQRSGGSSSSSSPASSPYTFQRLQPLPHLPHPERSLAFLRRLQEDRGIRHAMLKHQFTVGLLTEMDPLLYTQANHEGTTRTLGLNRNQGQIIELRLRTDAGDGYRDYNTVRRTLCHELAHNVHGPHDRQFWDLCHTLEREVDRADYIGHGGRTLSGEPTNFYEPPSHGEDEDEGDIDAGGWTGGSFVLGSGTPASTTAATPGGIRLGPTSSVQRSLVAQAAEARLQRTADEQRRQRQQQGSDAQDSSRKNDASGAIQ